MDKRGDTEGQDFLSANLIYIIAWLIIFTVVMISVTRMTNGEALWESFYAQQIAQVINSAEPGTNVTLDISPLVELAYKHVKPINKILTIDNVANKVTVSATNDGSSSFYYFNDVDVVDIDVAQLEALPGQSTVSFYIKERGR